MDRKNDHFEGRHYKADKISGPVGFLNPTTRYLPVHRPHHRGPLSSHGTEAEKTTSSGLRKEASHTGIYHVWRSRDNRKGRHAVVVHKDYVAKSGTIAPQATNSLRESIKGILKMFKRFPIWDVSYDVAVVFTLGSVVWVFNGFFVWLPIELPSSEFSGESTMGGGVTAFLGATIFEFGSVLLMLEAVNENRSDCFGWALEEALESGSLKLHPAHEGCRHHHKQRRSLFTPSRALNKTTSDETRNSDNDTNTDPRDSRKWQWWPTWYELRTHYFRDIGFLACFSQMIGATIFWIAGFTGLPPIFDVLSTPASNGVYWLPQVIGGSGFIISSWLFMLETQEKWYLPAMNTLGWHIGFWNWIGALGFTLCGALGFGINALGFEYASTLATFIGSWAFLIGSVVQWYESLDKYPVTLKKTETLEKGDSSPES